MATADAFSASGTQERGRAPGAPKRVRRPAAILETDPTALLVPVTSIVPGPNARSSWDKLDESSRQLANSIQERGIIEPLVVRERRAASSGERTFELLAGFRRFAAARYLDLPRVPVRIVAASDAEARATNLVENLAREDLADTDALRFLEQLNETYGWGVRQIARQVGRPASWVSDLLAVGRSKRERAAVESGQIAIATATRLVRLREAAPATRERLLRRVDAGERVLLDDVPRAQALRAVSAAKTGKKTTGASGTAASPKVDQPVAKKSARFTEYVELTRIEQAMYRNMRLSVRQVLVTIEKIWQAQGRHRRLPVELRRELEHTRDFIEEFLARDTGG